MIRGQSKAQAAKLRRYAVIREEFLSKAERCERCERRVELSVHHMRGRTGALLCDVRYFAALCHECHAWVHDHPASARLHGWIADRGEWGKQK